MSGPKISIYALTGRAREIVMGQIRCEHRAVACAERIKDILMELDSYSRDFEKQMGNVQLLMKRTSEGADQADRIQALQQKINNEIKSIRSELSGNMPGISVKYTVSEEMYSQKLSELKRLQRLKARAEKLMAESDSIIYQDKCNTSAIQSSIIKDLESSETVSEESRYMKRSDEGVIRKIQDSIMDDLNGVYSFEMPDENSDDEFRKRKSAIYDKILTIIKDEELSLSIINDAKNAVLMLERISSAGHLKNFDSVTVKPLLKKAENYKREQEEKKKGFAEKYAGYKALCTLAQENPKELDCSDSHIEFIDAEIQRIEQQLIRRREQEYIQESVDEVLSDMGYELIGSREVRKKSGKHFRNELYTFNEGTAVNVTFSSDGQISMELGGLAREDGIPSEEESKILTRDMESFCSEFSEFEKRMLAKGIVVGNRIALSPPTAEYAAIINMNDYDIDASVQVSEMKTAGKQRKQAKRKEMKIE